MGNSPPVGCPLATLEVVAPCRTPCKKAPLPSDPLPTDIAAGDTAGAGAGAGAGASPEAAGFDRKNTSVYNNHDFTWMSEVCYFLEQWFIDSYFQNFKNFKVTWSS